MLGKRSDQKGLWEADRLYLDYVGTACWPHCGASRDDDFVLSGQWPGQRAAQPAGHGGCCNLRQGERRRGQGEG